MEDEYSDVAMERLEKLFSMEKIVSSKNRKMLRVNFKAVANDKQNL